MKNIFVRTISIALVIVVLTSLCAIPASAEGSSSNNTSASYDWAYKPQYEIITVWGTYIVPGNTVVGYGNYTSGYYVLACQSGLKHLYIYGNYNCDPGDRDGAFGSITYNAIYRFQQIAEIDVDGYCGNQTWWSLEGLCPRF